MLDNTGKHIPPDEKRVNINKEGELDGCSNEFKVSKEQLKEAVDSVGTFPGAVKYHLMK